MSAPPESKSLLDGAAVALAASGGASALEAGEARLDRTAAPHCRRRRPSRPCRRSILLALAAALLLAPPRSAEAVGGPSAAFAAAPAVRPRAVSPADRTGALRRRMSSLTAYVDESTGSGGGSGKRSSGGGLPGREERTQPSCSASDVSVSDVAAGKPGGAARDDDGAIAGTSSPVNERRIDYAGAGTLGDIISDDDDEEEDESEETATGLGAVDVDPAADGRGAEVDAARSAPPLQRDHRRHKSPTKSGLVTSAGGTLQSRFAAKVGSGRPLSPLDRIALTANGNLQRIFSSYYDAPVHVHVDRCELRAGEAEAGASANGEGINGGGVVNGDGSRPMPRPPPSPPATWDRTVHLSVHGQTFCVASSVITVRDPECVRSVHAGTVGIGQLFRHLDKLPTFELMDAGRRCSEEEEEEEEEDMARKVNGGHINGGLGRWGNLGGGRNDGGLWRLYALRCDELECIIREDFSPDAWEIQPPVVDHYEEHDNTF